MKKSDYNISDREDASKINNIQYEKDKMSEKDITNEKDDLLGLYDITKLRADMDKAMDLDSITVSEKLI